MSVAEYVSESSVPETSVSVFSLSKLLGERGSTSSRMGSFFVDDEGFFLRLVMESFDLDLLGAVESGANDGDVRDVE